MAKAKTRRFVEGEAQLSQDEYDDLFPTYAILKAALSRALETRDFEIDLYWKRATYFWMLIAATFAAYALIFFRQGDGDKGHLLLVVVAGLGLVFSFAWCLVNKGSKYWQENWENHVGLLEDRVYGPLYKTVLERPTYQFSRIEEELELGAKVSDWITRPAAYSVSKINQVVSLYAVITWIMLGAFSLSLVVEYRVVSSVAAVISLCACWGLLRFGLSHHGGHSPAAYRRSVQVLKADA